MKLEFSKILAIWGCIISTIVVITSYILAALQLDTNTDVTNTVFTACIAYLISYAGKSLSEKMSRNKHGLDQDGQPWPNNMEDNISDD